ncbi:DUF2993 domain-containing protein [Streptomyces sp. SCSIO 30461]|uniref:LmeA family phospholipid-binding protein n=1 Tax=Streptomyces sp. SCSIO 30461 TaxID=3118085 RepID=UPI0030D097AF
MKRPSDLRLPRPFKRRKLLWTGATLSVALVALPVADRMAASAAEERLADRIAGQQKSVVGSPEVSIDAFPFLLSSAEGTFPKVAVRADAVTGDGQPVQASLELREVSESGKGGYTAASADARFTVPLDSLSEGLGDGTSLSAEDGRLRIDRQIFGMPLTIHAELRLSGRTISMVPVAASFAGSRIDPSSPRITEAFKDRERTVPELPVGLVPTRVAVTDDGVVLYAGAKNVPLA